MPLLRSTKNLREARRLSQRFEPRIVLEGIDGKEAAGDAFELVEGFLAIAETRQRADLIEPRFRIAIVRDDLFDSRKRKFAIALQSPQQRAVIGAVLRIGIALQCFAKQPLRVLLSAEHRQGQRAKIKDVALDRR